MNTQACLLQKRYFFFCLLSFFYLPPVFSQTNALEEFQNSLIPATGLDLTNYEYTHEKINGLLEEGHGSSKYCEDQEWSTSTGTTAFVTSEICSLSETDFDAVIGDPGTPVIAVLPIDLTIVNRKIWIRSTLVFDSDIIFRNCEIKLDPGVALLQKSGHTLNIDHSELTACTEVWLGIGAESNGTNIDLIASDSKIIGATIGMFSIDPFSVDFSIERTLFDRNHIGIAIDTDILGSPGGTISKFESNTFDCSSPIPGTNGVITRAGLLLSGQVVADASSNVYRNLEFGVLSEKGNSRYHDRFTLFSNLAEDGIFLREGSVDLAQTHFINYGRNGVGITKAREVDLNNCRFQLDEGFVPSLAPSTDPYVTNFICGVGVESFTMNGKLNIRNSRFIAESKENDVLTVEGQYIAGILLGSGTIGANTKISIFNNGWYYVTGKESSCIDLNGEFPISTETQVFNNDFRFDPLRLNEGNDAVAIWCRNGDKNNLSIYSNNFEGDKSNDFLGDPSTEHRGHGIWLTGSNGDNNDVSGNNFPTNYFDVYTDDFSVGIAARDFRNTRYCDNFLGNARSPIWIMLGDMTTELFANTMQVSNQHFVLSSCALGPQDHIGQKFLFKYAFGGSTAHASCFPIDASEMNKVKVHTEQSIENPTPPGFQFFSEYYPSRISPVTDWFSTTSGNPVENCQTQFAPNQEQKKFYKEIIENAWETTVNNPAFYSSLKSTVFKMLEEEPQVFTGETALLNFHKTNQNSLIGLTYQIRNKAKEYHSLTTNQSNVLEGIESQYSILKENLSSLETSINSTSDDFELATLKAEKINLLANWKNLDAQFKDITMAFLSSKSQLAQEGLDLLNGFMTKATHEIYFKTVYTIYFNRILQQGDLEEAQISTLIAIGNECPIEFGNIIDMARGMIPLCRRPYFEERDCMPEIEEEEEVLEESPIAPRLGNEQKGWSIFPNPNTGSFVINNIPLGSQIIISDIYGKVIKEEQSITLSSIPMNIPLEGVYILNIQTPSGKTITEKIIIANQ